MDDGEISEDESPPPSSDKRTFSEVFREVFPYYMAIGMSYDEFWNQDPYLAVYYREAHELKRDEENQRLWFNGLYTFIAVSTALSNIHFDGKKHKVNNYLTEPIRIRPKTEEELLAERDRNARLTIRKLDALKAAFDAAHKEDTKDAG